MGNDDIYGGYVGEGAGSFLDIRIVFALIAAVLIGWGLKYLFAFINTQVG